MNKIIPFPLARRDAVTTAVDAAQMPGIEDEELDIRLWELTMSGQRGNEEYQRIEAMISRRTSHHDIRRQMRFH